MHSDLSAVDHRRRPRRRGKTLDDAIFWAVMVELTEKGYARLSMESVAERARASKASLYRRWPGRTELVMDSMTRMLVDPADPPDTGSLRGDLLALLRRAAALLAGPAGEAMRGLLAEALGDSDRAQRFGVYARGQQGRTVMAQIVRRAAARGEVDAACATPRRLEAGQALLRHHFLFHGTPVPEAVIVEIVDEVLLPVLSVPPRGPDEG